MNDWLTIGIQNATVEFVLLASAALLLLSIFASKISTRLGIPALLLFLVIGMLIGEDGPGNIPFNDAKLAQSLGVVALAFILFSGGMNTEWTRIRPVLIGGVSLATVGVLVTAGIIGVVMSRVFGLTLVEGLLIGAIVAPTDAAAVFSVLSGRGVGLKGRMIPLLEMESGSNDPMAIFLTVGMIQLLLNPAETTGLTLGILFVQQMGVGALVGYAAGQLLTTMINRSRLEYDGLYPVLTIAFVMLTYGATAALGGNPFLAVYLAGLMLGQRDFIHKKSLLRFHDGLAWLMQIVMFLTLGLLVTPSEMTPLVVEGLVVSAVLIFAARPASVFLSLLFTRMTLREKLMISWVGLKGAAPIVLATFPLLAGLDETRTIFNIVFFVVLTSVLLQGTTIPWVARLLRVDKKASNRRQYPIEFTRTKGIKADLFEVEIPDNSVVVGRQILDFGLPPGCLIVLIGRDSNFIVPNGNTVIQARDTLLVLTDPSRLRLLETMIAQTTMSES
jgi:cell volume regulation protein A